MKSDRLSFMKHCAPIMYGDGMTIGDISSLFKCSNTPVRKAITESGMEFRHVGHRKYKTSINERYFDVIDTEEKAYWLGFLMADGGVKNGNIKLELAIKDAEHVSLFAKTLESGYKVTDHVRLGGYGQRSTTIYSRYMCDSLAKLGVTEKKSKTAAPPDIGQNLMRHMVRGLIDGDGWIYQGSNKNIVQVGLCGSYDCCSYFSKWVSDLFGYEPSVTERGNVHNCVVSKSGVSCAVLAELYCSSNVHLNRKRDKAFRIWVEA